QSQGRVGSRQALGFAQNGTNIRLYFLGLNFEQSTLPIEQIILVVGLASGLSCGHYARRQNRRREQQKPHERQSFPGHRSLPLPSESSAPPPSLMVQPTAKVQVSPGKKDWFVRSNPAMP